MDGGVLRSFVTLFCKSSSNSSSSSRSVSHGAQMFRASLNNFVDIVGDRSFLHVMIVVSAYIEEYEDILPP